MADKGDGTDDAATAPHENSTTKEVRCVTLTGFGGIRQVKVTRKPEPRPELGEVLVRVRTCGISFTDLMVRQGAVDNPPKTPFTLGFECAGEVEALGEGVSKFAIGDRVIAVTDYRAWSELVAVSEQFVYALPTGMTYADGAALLVNYVSAYSMLFDLGNLREGQAVLVHSAGGGMGIAVAQLCRTVRGATLFGTASALKHEALKGLTDHVYDHSVDYTAEIRKISPGGVDIVLDSLCGEDTNKGINLLKPLGKYILYGSSNVVTGETKSFFSFAKSWWQMDKISPIRLYDENKTIGGFHLRQLLFKQGGHAYVRGVLDTLFKLYNEGKIKPIIDSTWAFEDVAEAMQKMHDRKNIGKLLLDPSLEPKPPSAEKLAQQAGDSPREGSGEGDGGSPAVN